MTDRRNVKNINNGGTVFYRRRIGDWLRRYAIELVIIAGVIVFAIVTTIITTNARRIFREAKDVRYALKFIGTEYYGGNSSIYDPSKATGLADGAAEAVARISTHDGQVFLYAWDEDENMPLRFEYRKGAYTVVYTAETEDPETEEARANQMMGHWDITYSFSVLSYDAE